MKNKILILGAGIGGLAMGKLSNGTIIERNSGIVKGFGNGIHYFHSIPEMNTKTVFKTIPIIECVYDGIETKKDWSIEDLFNYSKKTTGIIQPCSIMDVGKRTVCYLPEKGSADDILDNLSEGQEIKFNESVVDINAVNQIATTTNAEYEYDYLISTLPLNILMKTLKLKTDIEFKNVPIHIVNFKINNFKNFIFSCYVSNHSSIYRISIMNGRVSVESSMKESEQDCEDMVRDIVGDVEMEFIDYFVWETGKIVSISKEDRKALLSDLINMKIIPIGRYGLWNRKLLMDTTINQAVAVNRFLNSEISEEELIEYLS